jgi:hypothetical protein
MILSQKSEDEVISSLESSSFEISAQNVGLLFSTISEGLYSNPISSIVREITSNAVDATTEAGKVDPVIVELNKDTSGYYLKIQDFGVGISEERIENTYKKLFESTKRQSNDYIGAYGIGRFSIFSYTNSYYLTTVYDGYKYEYQLFLNNSIPDIILLDKSETDESNGTSVKIPVEVKDLYNFSNAIRQTLLYFNNVYVVDCVVEFNNEEFKIYRERNYLHNPLSKHTELHLSVGGVYYPIDWYSIDEKNINLNVAIELPNGSVDTTRSRENIRYTEATTKIVKEAVCKFREYIENKYSEVKENIDLETTDYKTLGYVGKNINHIELFGLSFNVYDEISNSLRKVYNLTYNNKPVNIYDSLPFIINKYNYYSKKGKYTNELTSFTDILNIIRNNNNKYWYFFESEKAAVAKKLPKLRYNGITLCISPTNKSKNFLRLNSKNNINLREYYNYWIDVLCLLKTKLNIKHVSEYSEPKKEVNYNDTVKYYQYGDYDKYGTSKKNILRICNLSKEKAELISRIYKNTWIAVYKIPKNELNHRPKNIKTMSELLETNKFHKLMFYYKLKQQFPDFELNKIKKYVSLDYLQNFEDFDITPPVSQFMDELLQEYESKHPLDNLDYIIEKFRHLEEFSYIVNSISGVRGQALYRILRITAKGLKIKLLHEIENVDLIEKVLKLYDIYLNSSTGYNTRSKIEKYVDDVSGDSNNKPFELLLYKALQYFEINNPTDLYNLAERNFIQPQENEIHSN